MRPTYFATGNERELFRAAHERNLPVMLKGPTGCGKTRFVEAMAEELGRPLITLACNEDLTVADLVGRFLIHDGQTQWVDGPLTRAVRTGAICYLDEIVEARQDTTVVIHPLTDHRRILVIDRTAEVILPADGFQLVVSYNPGYQSVLKDLKESTRQRMVAISFDYPDEQVEVEIIRDETGIDEPSARHLVAIGSAIRRVDAHGLKEVASTRTLVTAAHLCTAGISLYEAATAAIAEPLTDDRALNVALTELIAANTINGAAHP
ncbi:Denitrification regulatory protein NirQ [Mycolicibacterium vanbaalenii]|uniref:Denitrification regulatory protein NirQ n=1 Tax=Mycolicibacterium vanbaalenii TaxID=110539 RepID=A0A5S9R9N0_MYCVN|nr:CbbQ/NirQ/NorQ/GpvN family protein [Mycolicibacterium vanbaalenii]CAA0137504.1 Denitrification regulatory protein NirQ [Mycolicibacterium vanbaalenii]